MNDDLFQRLRDDMKTGFSGIHERLDQLNGRVRDTETDVAVLKDRNGRRATIWGGGAGAGVVATVEAIRAYFK